MPTLEGKILRLACNQSSSDPILDTLTELPPVLWRGAAANLQCALFTDTPASGTIVSDITNITQVELIVRERNSSGTVLLDKTITDAAVGACLWAAWVDLSDQHFEFSLVDVDTNQAVPASGVLNIYLAIKVTTEAGSFVVAQGSAQLVDVGIVDVATPVSPSLTPVTTDETLVTDGDAVVFSGTSGSKIRKATGLEAFSFTDDGAPFRPWFDSANQVWARKVEPKIYRALLTQSSTSAPSATVMENSLGGTLVWTRTGTGTYIGTLASAFTVNKTWAVGPPAHDLLTFSLRRTSANVVTITTQDDAITSDGVLNSDPVEILVYP